MNIKGLDKVQAKLSNDNMNNMIQAILTTMSDIIMVNAKINAPVKTGNLRRSLSVDLSRLTRNLAMVYSDVPYAGVRELSNNLHPSTKYYMQRGYTEHTAEIENAIIGKVNSFLA